MLHPKAVFPFQTSKKILHCGLLLLKGNVKLKHLSGDKEVAIKGSYHLTHLFILSDAVRLLAGKERKEKL